MKKKLTSVVVKRVMWTISFLFIYVLGSRLTLPVVNVGLSPWMSAMILWQMFSMSKKLCLGSLPLEVQDRRKMILTFVIALIQALAITLNLPIQSGVNYGLVLTMNVLLLIAGTFFLVWLSDLNSLFGVGGALVILMSSMVSSMPQNILKSIKELEVGPLLIVALLMLSMVFLAIAVRVQRARYRILVNKIMIHNRFKRYSYLDILLNPAGGMPFMYAMSLVSIPQYSLLLLQMVLPKESWIGEWISRFAIGQPIWIFTYIVVLFILGLAFSFVNMNGEEIAEKMKKSGEYIYNIYPGEETSRYINWLILRFAVIGSTYTVLMAGLPMLIVLYDPRYMQLTMLPGLFLIFNGMVFNIKEEIDALTLNENYRPLLEIDS